MLSEELVKNTPLEFERSTKERMMCDWKMFMGKSEKRVDENFRFYFLYFSIPFYFGRRETKKA